MSHSEVALGNNYTAENWDYMQAMQMTKISNAPHSFDWKETTRLLLKQEYCFLCFFFSLSLPSLCFTNLKTTQSPAATGVEQC